jgi:undecaprenyl-diphosphatase
MSYAETIFLGIVQGITEFLPVSSSGHLTILQELMGRELENVELNIALHLGTLLSILVIYRNDLPEVLRQPRLCLAIVVATLPVIPVGLFLKDALEQAFASTFAVGACLCVTGLLMALSRRIEHGERSLSEITMRDALIVGVFQAVAPLPGISRAGSTIFGGLACGLHRDAAAKFSFLIAIPAIAGATVLYSKEILESGSSGADAGPLIAGTAVAFVVGVLSLRGLLQLVSRQRLSWFAWYCLTLGVATMVWQAWPRG